MMGNPSASSAVSYPTASRLMRLARAMGMEKLAWSLRRLYCPVDSEALVLEVGSGGNPYFRANVLVDAYEETSERHWVALVADRPTVLAFAETLPFQDKAFDFVIASHVLEHSRDPARFLEEMQRVGKAGYIEVPDAFMERVNPYPDHRLEITTRDGRLVIRTKKAWQVDPELVELYEDRAKAVIAGQVIPAHPFEFHVRYYWQGEINYEMLDSGNDIPIEPPPGTTVSGRPTLKDKLHAPLRNLVRRLFSQHRRNRQIVLDSLLRCPKCHAGGLKSSSDHLACTSCGARYPVHSGVPNMTGAGARSGA